jgi:hypothetical protein
VDAVAAYDRAAGDLRVRVSELVKQLAAANWPTPEEAHAAICRNLMCKAPLQVIGPLPAVHI